MPGVSAEPPKAVTELRPRFKISLGEYVASMAVLPRGEVVLVGLGDGRVLGLDTSNGDTRFKREAHTNGLLGVGVAPDGRRFVTCGQDDTARLWSAEGDAIADLPGVDNTWVEHVAWSPAGSHVALAAGKRVRVFTSDGALTFESEPLASSVTSLAWRKDGAVVAASCYGGVHLLPVGSGLLPRHLRWKGSLVALAWSPNSKVIAAASQDASVHFWRLPTGQDSEMRGYRFKPKALAWDSASSLLATSGDAIATVWDFSGQGPEGTRPIQLKAHQGLCTQLAFNPRKCVLATGSQDTSVLLWEPRRGDRPVRFGFLDDEVTSLAWHGTDNVLFGGDAAGTVAGWEVS
jgi:WD40 repeat protein